jgi:hypothetical protein
MLPSGEEQRDGPYANHHTMPLVNVPVRLSADSRVRRRSACPYRCRAMSARREEHALSIVCDEFRPVISRSGWSPPEPASASQIMPLRFGAPEFIIERQVVS